MGIIWRPTGLVTPATNDRTIISMSKVTPCLCACCFISYFLCEHSDLTQLLPFMGQLANEKSLNAAYRFQKSWM